MLITVFTPTYNRADLLSQLYASLLVQKHQDFEWVIVDDGSTDATKAVVAGFIAEQKIPIHYYYKSNGGKHSAINFGVQQANGGLFFIVDSDDYLSDNALALTYDAWLKIKDNPKVCGILGLSEYTSGSIVGDSFLEDDWIIPFVAYYFKYNLRGDKSVAFKTELLKAYPFPEKEGVRFVSESVVWYEMSKKYDVFCLNQVLQYKEYLGDGYSDSSYKYWFVKSMAFTYFHLINNSTYPFSIYPKQHLSNYTYLISNSLLSNESYFWNLKGLRRKLLYLVLFPRGYFSYLRMKNKMVS